MVWVQRVRETFWLVPALMCVGASLVAQALLVVDRSLADDALDGTGALLYQVGADGARDVLGAIAGSMLAVASTTFSITIAVLALTSSSYGPRLVRNFMADRGNQVVLGTYLATYLYTLLVLRSIRTLDGDAQVFVPQLAVNGAVLLAVASIGVLVWFIHHISDSIQVWTLAGRVHGELRAVVADLYPERLGSEGDVDDAAVAAALLGEPDLVVHATRCGYVLRVDHERLMRLATERDLVVELLVRPGSFVVEQGALAAVRRSSPGPGPGDRAWARTPGHAGGRADGRVSTAVRRSLPLADARSPLQDVEFATQQLVEMLVRALSPSTNDPYTAVNAVDQLSDGLAALARRRVPSPARVDGDGRVRVVAPAVELHQLLDMVVDAVVTYGMGHPDVVRRCVELLGRVGEAGGAAVRAGLLERLDRLVGHSALSEVDDDVRSRLDADGARVRAALGGA